MISLSCQPKHTHRKGNAFVVNALGLVPGIVLMMVVFSSSPWQRKPVWTNAIKKIVGHCIDDVAEKSYTKRDIEWIRTELERVK